MPYSRETCKTNGSDITARFVIHCFDESVIIQGMSRKVFVNSVSDIDKAMELVDEYTSPLSDRNKVVVCRLVCEELLINLLNTGCTDIRISQKGLFVRRIEITAEGGRADDCEAAPKNGQESIETGINRSLLEQYSNHYTFRYKRGINIYEVFSGAKSALDLSEEIYDYYKNAGPDKPHKTTAVLGHIIRHHRGFFFLSVFNILVKHLAALMLPVFVANIINTVVETGTFFCRPVYLNIILSIASLSLNLICFSIDSHHYRRFTRTVESGLRMALVQKLQMLSMRFHRESQSGVILSKLISDVQFIQMLIYDRFLDMIHLSEDILFIIVIAMLRFPLMLAFYIVIVPVDIILLRHFSKPLQERRSHMRRETEQVNAAVKEMIEMVSLTRSHGLENTEYRNILHKVRKAQMASMQYDIKTVSVNNISFGGFQGLKLISLSVTALLAALGYIDIGTLVLFQSIFDLIVNNVQKMLEALPMISQGYDSLVSINEILYSSDIEQNGTKVIHEPIKGEIEFKHVSFSYEDGKNPVLNDISFKVPAGGSVAFVGRSGQGKTTILNLILGLNSVKSGEILIDGMNLDDLEKTAYRHNIAVVPQNTVLFSGTLWDNLVYGMGYVSPDQVMEVIHRVGLDDLVKSQPEGLYMKVLENGANLSGGQRQRISIVRALLRKPRIILLDEATSALDVTNEKQVQDAIDAMMGVCTVVMVCHRLNTLRHADVVYKVQDGKLQRFESFDQVLQEMKDESENESVT